MKAGIYACEITRKWNRRLAPKYFVTRSARSRNASRLRRELRKYSGDVIHILSTCPRLGCWIRADGEDWARRGTDGPLGHAPQENMFDGAEPPCRHHDQIHLRVLRVMHDHTLG